MFWPVEHAVNRDGEVAVFVAPFEHRPTGWWADAKGIWVIVPGQLDTAISVSPGAFESLASQDRLLIVEVDEHCNFETWVSAAAA